MWRQNETNTFNKIIPGPQHDAARPHSNCHLQWEIPGGGGALLSTVKLVDLVALALNWLPADLMSSARGRKTTDLKKWQLKHVKTSHKLLQNVTKTTVVQTVRCSQVNRRPIRSRWPFPQTQTPWPHPDGVGQVFQTAGTAPQAPWHPHPLSRPRRCTFRPPKTSSFFWGGIRSKISSWFSDVFNS